MIDFLSFFFSSKDQIYAVEDNSGENVIGHPKLSPFSILQSIQSSTNRDRRSESAERYFNWMEKNQRSSFSFSILDVIFLLFSGPIEYFRGKRFWLFAKKDESPVNVEYVPTVQTKQNSLEQGLWRSGIVGRRRR